MAFLFLNNLSITYFPYMNFGKRSGAQGRCAPYYKGIEEKECYRQLAS